MSIVFNNTDAALIQGLQQGGSALINALSQANQLRTAQQQQRNLGAIVGQGPIDQTLLAKVIAQPGGSEFLQGLAPILGPIFKEQARAQGAQSFLQQNFPQLGAAAAQPRVSPIEEARSAMTNVPSISGVPSKPPIADENRVGPREQTMYQQGGQQGMGINPSQETVNSPAPGQFDLSQLTNEDVVRLAGSPYKEHQNLARAEMERRKPELQESAEIRKEDRAEIKQYSEPYKDINKLDVSVKKLQKAKELIQSRKVSLDENLFRRFSTALLEDKGLDSIAQYFKSDEQKTLFALLKDYFKTKDIGGSNPSTKEVLLSLSTLPSENLGKQANLLLINELLKDAMTRQQKGKIIAELRNSGKKFTFGEFQKAVEDNAAEYLSPIETQFEKEATQAQYYKQIEGKKPQNGYVWAVNPDGNLGQIPKSNIRKFEQAGGTILNE